MSRFTALEEGLLFLQVSPSSRVYLLLGSDSHTLVQAVPKLQAERLLHALAELGIEAQQIRDVVLLALWPDRFAALHQLEHARLHVCSPVDATLSQTFALQQQRFLPLLRAIAGDEQACLAETHALAAADVLQHAVACSSGVEALELELSGQRARLIPCPGLIPGSAVLQLESRGLLFCGDALAEAGGLGFVSDACAHLQMLEQLQMLPCRWLLSNRRASRGSFGIGLAKRLLAGLLDQLARRSEPMTAVELARGDFASEGESDEEQARALAMHAFSYQLLLEQLVPPSSADETDLRQSEPM